MSGLFKAATGYLAGKWGRNMYQPIPASEYYPRRLGIIQHGADPKKVSRQVARQFDRIAAKGARA